MIEDFQCLNPEKGDDENVERTL